MPAHIHGAPQGHTSCAAQVAASAAGGTTTSGARQLAPPETPQSLQRCLSDANLVSMAKTSYGEHRNTADTPYAQVLK